MTFLRDNLPVTEFYALLTVEQCDAASLQTILLTHLETTGINLQRISDMSTDGASVMTGQHNGLATRLRSKIPHLVSCHCVAHKRVRALAAKDAALAFPDLQIVDKVVRAVADILRRLVVHTRFKELQEVICEAHLEMQGIKDVRWLSRGHAIQRFVAVFPAVVIVLREFDSKMYAVVTSFKFHFLLYFLADVLKELNLLNIKFQRRQIDATHVLQTVHNTTLLLRNRYIDSNDETFGAAGEALGPFLTKHVSGECREVQVAGPDATGVPTTHRYILHEVLIEWQTSGRDISSCLKLGRDFVVELIGRLDFRLQDLASLNGAKLFKKSQYPKSQVKRERLMAQWLQSLRAMYKKDPEDPDTLPVARVGSEVACLEEEEARK
ncbi:unnamed protein product [Closterium sp. NIES-53]